MSYSPRKIFRIWRGGCGNTIPFKQGPWRCHVCTFWMIAYWTKACLMPWRWLGRGDR